MSIYKYLPQRYEDGFVKRGEVLFRALSYFHDLESADGRADAYEGTRRFRPREGLEVNNITSGQKFNLPESFSLESTAKTDDIFVFCTSTLLSEALAREFKAAICIEIVEEIKFISRLRDALIRRPRVRPPKTLLHAPVNYYDSADPPIVDWALPDRIAMSKPIPFAYQLEYRFAFCVNDAFRVENTTQIITTQKRTANVRVTPYPQELLVLGSLRKLVRVHRFNRVVA